MRLYKAINYNYNDEKILNSNIFVDKNLNINTTSCFCDFEDLIYDALYINTDRKKENHMDYWIPTTNRFEIALSLLNNSQSFNGIAIIDLPNTNFSGYFYDDYFNKCEYIDKNLSLTDFTIGTNEDGIIAIWDLSSKYTKYFLGSYMLFKFGRTFFEDSDIANYTDKDLEFLIFGKNIRFTFLNKDEANYKYEKFASYANFYLINDYNKILYEFIEKRVKKIKPIMTDHPLIEYEDNTLLLKAISSPCHNEWNRCYENEKDYLRKRAINDNRYFGEEYLKIDECKLFDNFIKDMLEYNDKIIKQFYKSVMNEIHLPDDNMRKEEIDTLIENLTKSYLSSIMFLEYSKDKYLTNNQVWKKIDYMDGMDLKLL